MDLDLIQIIEYGLRAVVAVSLHMNVPDMLGQYHEQKKSCQNADKKCLSFFVPVKKEGQSVFFYDFHTGTGLSAYGFHLVKPGDTHIHFVEPFPVLQIPDRDIMVGTHIQETFRAAALQTDADIAFAVIIPSLQLCYLPFSYRKETRQMLPVIFISSLV